MLKEITVLGDSIARGIMYDTDAERYRVCKNTFVNVLTEMGYSVKNLSRMGCTIDKAEELFDMCEKKEGALVAIELGSNDSDLNWNEVSENPDVYHEAQTPLTEYIARLTALLQKAKSFGMRPVVVTPLPLVADRYMDWISRGLDADALRRYLKSSARVYRWQERYAFEALKVAAKENCPVFDLRSEFLSRPDFDTFFCEDGIHPNMSGHALISEAVRSAGLTHLDGALA